MTMLGKNKDQETKTECVMVKTSSFVSGLNLMENAIVLGICNVFQHSALRIFDALNKKIVRLGTLICIWRAYQ